MRSLLTCCLLVVSAVAGCSADEPSPPAPGPPSAEAAGHSLALTQTYGPGPSGALYIEGALADVVLADADGEEHRLTGEPSSPLTFDQLAPGTYTLRAGLLPCQANCDSPGAKTDSCEVEVEVPGTQRLTIRYMPGYPCTVAPV